MKLTGYINIDYFNNDVEVYRNGNFFYILNGLNKYMKLGHISYIAFYVRDNEVSFCRIN